MVGFQVNRSLNAAAQTKRAWYVTCIMVPNQCRMAGSVVFNAAIECSLSSDSSALPEGQLDLVGGDRPVGLLGLGLG